MEIEIIVQQQQLSIECLQLNELDYKIYGVVQKWAVYLSVCR
ncbi:hypothetical protein H1P_660019 [Hyella patelloides LEGE 07179]|uniref:Uncharacterized protein n=1 Tax=Hyella patelloides LEGE 07179 TaxID=945734 RepID=A0A563W2J3_9CYAN|nr:hypothetical protein H1P_660019 [Hyella patelloides LEGE 07179]